MKNAILFLALLFSLSLSAQVSGKMSADGKTIEYTPTIKTVDQVTKGCTKTDVVFVTKSGESKPVWKNANGRMFYVSTSKTGNNSRRYIDVVK